MSWSVTADVERFDEAMEWFDERVPVTPEQIETLTTEQRVRAITIAGITEANMVADVFAEIANAAESGEGIDVFRKRIKVKLGDAWTKSTAHKLDTAMVTTTQTAYNAGRYKQLTDTDVMRTREFWIYDSVVDDRTTFNCQALDQFTAPADDAQWAGIYPPGHHRCRAGIRSQTRRQVERRRTAGTAKEAKPEVNVPEGFGKLPSAAPWKPKKSDYPPDVWNSFKRKERAMKAKVKRDEKKAA